MEYRTRLSANGIHGSWRRIEAEHEGAAVLGAAKSWYTSGATLGKREETASSTWNPDGPGTADLTYARWTVRAYNHVASVDVLLSVTPT